jgi:endonuclease/exonuclease/phosphatase family metal-dependent hydrolase
VAFAEAAWNWVTNPRAGAWPAWPLGLAAAALLALAVPVLLWVRSRWFRRRLAEARRASPNEFQRSLDIRQVTVKNPHAEPPQSSGRGWVRILSWNVGRGHQPEQLAEYLQGARADIVCLQEVDWNNRRTHWADVLDRLAGCLGMRGYFGVEFLEICTPFRTAALAGGGVTGNALLLSSAPVAVFRIELPATMDWEFDWNVPPFSERLWKRIRREKRIGGRFALAAECRIAGRTLVVCSTHLENFTGGAAGRFAQYRSIVEDLERRYGDSAIRVIAGDFNTFGSPLAHWYSGDGSATWPGKPGLTEEPQLWKAQLLPPTGYRDPFELGAWTFQVTPLFRRKLDWFTVKGGRIRAHGIGPFGSSDHRPLWVDLEL